MRSGHRHSHTLPTDHYVTMSHGAAYPNALANTLLASIGEAPVPRSLGKANETDPWAVPKKTNTAKRQSRHRTFAIQTLEVWLWVDKLFCSRNLSVLVVSLPLIHNVGDRRISDHLVVRVVCII
eukprot:3669861-Rhodomonas_salina.1